ncbi:MAG: hypothetical protein L0Y71_15040 [Gemmataceae bacterium]|nr:hypothetical protein [Gemmataceae bacterium]
MGRRLAFSADARLLALAAGAGVRLWDLASRQELTAKIDAHTCHPSQIIVSSKGFVATASDDNTVRIWDAATTKQRQRFVGEGWMRAIALSPDGALVAASSMSNVVYGTPALPAKSMGWRVTATWADYARFVFFPMARVCSPGETTTIFVTGK